LGGFVLALNYSIRSGLQSPAMGFAPISERYNCLAGLLDGHSQAGRVRQGIPRFFGTFRFWRVNHQPCTFFRTFSKCF